ncbi:hypothetical protein [Clostridium manihotivorum]|uniref:Uncharacterized protein n=1 Tax=Clostridium manihotivorum TaxID=2320868 RepID=A0A3R5UHN2_9CLOT|nr:hypothetical protein [Clostridium manihotivorum]QAA33943.1 hypothetical protein C1I91_21200 [Clostridium manihotivorum]
MKKETRDLKKHYRHIEKTVRNFIIDLSEESWYGMWHAHLDWDGITSISDKHRKIHILNYIRIFDKIDEQTKESDRKFQTWIYLDGSNGYNDAIYFHTENPEIYFPYCLENVEWNKEIPKILIGLLNFSDYRIGVLKGSNENAHSYIIQKKGLGLDIATGKQYL